MHRILITSGLALAIAAGAGAAFASGGDDVAPGYRTGQQTRLDDSRKLRIRDRDEHRYRVGRRHDDGHERHHRYAGDGDRRLGGHARRCNFEHCGQDRDD